MVSVDADVVVAEPALPVPLVQFVPIVATMANV